MIDFLRYLLIPLCVIFIIYIFCSMRIMHKVDDQLMNQLLEDKGCMSYGNIVRFPDRKERKEILLEAVAKSKGVKHKKIATFVVKSRDTIRVLFGIFLGLFIYLTIKMVF